MVSVTVRSPVPHRGPAPPASPALPWRGRGLRWPASRWVAVPAATGAVALGVACALRPLLAVVLVVLAVLVAAVWARPALAACLLIFLTPLTAGIDRGSALPVLRPQEALAVLLGGTLAVRGVVRLRAGQLPSMEYMAFGLPFVSFDLTETRALAGEAAVYAPPGDVAGFARLIDELLSDPVRRAELGLAGRQLVTERVAWDRQEDTYLGVYQRLLGKPRAGLPDRAGAPNLAGKGA